MYTRLILYTLETFFFDKDMFYNIMSLCKAFPSLSMGDMLYSPEGYNPNLQALKAQFTPWERPGIGYHAGKVR